MWPEDFPFFALGCSNKNCYGLMQLVGRAGGNHAGLSAV